MRIVGGALGGRRFGEVHRGTRPTSDRAREAIASALSARELFEHALVLDLFAGTGAMSFEALSRGADSAVLVESHRPAASSIRKSARALGLEERCRVAGRDLYQESTWPHLARQGPFQLVFCDPPYAELSRAMTVLRALQAAGAFEEATTIVLEHSSRDRVEGELQAYVYGEASVKIFAASALPALKWTIASSSER